MARNCFSHLLHHDAASLCQLIRLHRPEDHIPVVRDSVSGWHNFFCCFAFLGISDTGEMYLRTRSIRLDGHG